MMQRSPFLLLLALSGLLACGGLASAAAPESLGGQALDYARGTSYFRMAVLLTLLSIVPALIIATTAFTRIIIVLSSVRLGLGMQETPPNIVLMVLALFLTSFVMFPTMKDIQQTALTPYLAGQLTSSEFLEKAATPLEQFMLDHTRPQEIAAVARMAGSKHDKDAEVGDQAKTGAIGLQVLVPAFMLSELRVAFQMAFMVLLPFLLVDLIVAVTLMALGMMMVPPSTLSLPLKILMFVLVDGWIVLARSLIGSYSS